MQHGNVAFCTGAPDEERGKAALTSPSLPLPPPPRCRLPAHPAAAPSAACATVPCYTASALACQAAAPPSPPRPPPQPPPRAPLLLCALRALGAAAGAGIPLPPTSASWTACTTSPPRPTTCRCRRAVQAWQAAPWCLDLTGCYCTASSLCRRVLCRLLPPPSRTCTPHLLPGSLQLPAALNAPPRPHTRTHTLPSPCPPQDLLCWRGYAMYDCAAEFRLFWLASKFKEEEGLVEVRLRARV